MAPKFVARDRKQHKKSKTYDTHYNAETTLDSNELVVLPSSAAEKAHKDERRKEMEAELKKGMSKISSKKQKRMNKYIVSHPSRICPRVELTGWVGDACRTRN